ncbi:hypothetical protein [Corynebacterium rhinophilum]|uniref:hypothetical protein n=1 Tax=Corynebacterium rhinophilum TaxID=3050197 RepID=UPI002550627B|nr:MULTISPECIES: hypothetical protein [unclassified Corynebacterium]MDK8466944.1 hypothetical protein [Corynebacterium sp. MSK130]MDK8687568.1 hypothetical protein [Corynebacterium sp. MSK122]
MPYPMLPPQDQHIIISAMRHCRERPSYFLRHTTRWVIEHWDELDERTQAQLIRGSRLDIHLNAQLTQDEKEQLNQEQPEWEAYLKFIEGKKNE